MDRAFEPDRLSICMLSNLYPPVVSGSSSHCSMLARELALRGHRVRVITACVDQASAAHEIEGGVEVFRVPALRLPRLRVALNFPWLSLAATPANARLIRTLIADHATDVLHVHNHMFDLSLLGGRVARTASIPMVLTIHTVIEHSSGFWNAILRVTDKGLLGRLVIARATSIIAPDVNIQRYVETRFGRRASVVPYGIACGALPSNVPPDILRERLQLQGMRVILSVGHVHSIRNRHDLIRALPMVVGRFPEVCLVILGEEMTDTTRALAAELDVLERVRFVGSVPHDEVAAYLSIADIEAHWLHQEPVERTSCGIATLEAMASGVATITSANLDTYGMGVLQDGINIVQAARDRPDLLAEQIMGLRVKSCTT